MSAWFLDSELSTCCTGCLFSKRCSNIKLCYYVTDSYLVAVV